MYLFKLKCSREHSKLKFIHGNITILKLHVRNLKAVDKVNWLSSIDEIPLIFLRIR